jgi:hypothetical protein
MTMKTNTLERDGYSINEFAETHSISRSQTYVELNSGRLVGSKVGNKTIITRENAAAWRKNLPKFQPP